ncbi:MAG: hypothetical protein L0Z50_10040 [Verrucomicrobiales bacterium]|nr:hypothetical protein [Verrucomicrobiales bacterium]
MKPKKAPDFLPVFNQLRKLLAAHAGEFIVARDEAREYWLETDMPRPDQRPVCVGGVRIEKNYVSYHLMAVSGCPGLLQEMSPALKKRMQGKSCFNFTALDETLSDELAEVTRRNCQAFGKGGPVERMILLSQKQRERK